MSEINGGEEDWDLLRSFFPANWEELAQSTNAMKGLRQDKSTADCLRVLVLHVGCGLSRRETVARARTVGLADLSDVALLKRLRTPDIAPWEKGRKEKEWPRKDERKGGEKRVLPGEREV